MSKKFEIDLRENLINFFPLVYSNGVNFNIQQKDRLKRLIKHTE